MKNKGLGLASSSFRHLQLGPYRFLQIKATVPTSLLDEHLKQMGSGEMLVREWSGISGRYLSLKKELIVQLKLKAT